MQALDFSSSEGELALALASRRGVLADKETALQRWAVALECESARQASERRALQAKAEQVGPGPPIGMVQHPLLCLPDWLRAAMMGAHKSQCVMPLLVQVARQSQAVDQAEAERAELAHQSAELASEQAALQEQQKAAEQEHDRLAALAADLAAQQATLAEQRSLIQEAAEKAKASPHNQSKAFCSFQSVGKS